jgi:hypothetical protein
MCNSLSGVMKKRRSINKSSGSACDRCSALEANDHETIAYFVSLLDWQDQMWTQGESAKAKDLEGAISKARHAVLQTRTYLVMHRANHRQDAYTSSTYRPNTNRQRSSGSIHGKEVYARKANSRNGD